MSTPSATSPPPSFATAAPPISLSATICCVLLGAVWLLSAGLKLQNLLGFELILIGQGLVTQRVVAEVLSRTLVIGEILIGLGLLIPGWRRRFFLPLSFLLLIGFTLYMGWLAIGGNTENCGCFGSTIKVTPWQAVLKNLALLVLNVVALRHLRDHASAFWLWFPVAAVIVTAVVVFGFKPTRVIPTLPPTNSLVAVPPTSVNSVPPASVTPTVTLTDAPPVTAKPPAPAKPSPFARFKDFKPQPLDVTSGTVVVAMLSLDCDHCQEVTKELVAARASFGNVPVAAVFLGEPNQVDDFFTKAGGRFPWMIADIGDFFDLVGNAPPRVYLLDRGQTVMFWDLDTFNPAAVAGTIQALAVQQRAATPAK